MKKMVSVLIVLALFMIGCGDDGAMGPAGKDACDPLSEKVDKDTGFCIPLTQEEVDTLAAKIKNDTTIHPNVAADSCPDGKKIDFIVAADNTVTMKCVDE